MIFIVLALFGFLVSVITWGWLKIAADQRMAASLGVPPSVEGTTSKHSGLFLRLMVGAVIFGGSLLGHLRGDRLIPYLGALLLAFILFFEARTIRKLVRRSRE